MTFEKWFNKWMEDENNQSASAETLMYEAWKAGYNQAEKDIREGQDFGRSMDPGRYR